ncbi:MAG TPA: sigma 54-interacting transcriptional regulator [Kofleriaceae bacterium]|nr:sigma 54-interacting transcriptional regulator [Kofleriaceae bacterium]
MWEERTREARWHAAADDARLQLVVMTATGGVLEFDLATLGELVVGRAQTADIHIDSRSVSREHAAITVDAQRITVRDCGSTNGTFVNGQRLDGSTGLEIAAGDVVQFGEIMAQVRALRSSMVVSAAFVPPQDLEARLEEEADRCLRFNCSLVLIAVDIEDPEREICARARQVVRACLRTLDIASERSPGRIEAILRECSRDSGIDIARRALAALNQIGARARVGVATYPDDVPSPNSLAIAARMAMRDAGDDVGIAKEGARLIKLGDREAVIADPGMVRLFGLVERVAAGSIAVLIHGETGTGKEIIAEAIHQMSPRAQRTFIKLNCAAVPDNLLESELFGYERGAFSGAAATKVGLYEKADGGTLLLDEIGEMPPAIQAKLLRVIEDGRVRRLGATTDRRVDVRVVAATHRDLKAAASAGRFREDLYFRLSAMVLEVPPLRERKREIALLAERFCALAAREIGCEPPAISPAAMAALSRYAWPGNVRELVNAVSAAVMMSAGDTVEPGHLSTEITSARDLSANEGEEAPATSLPTPRSVGDSTGQVLLPEAALESEPTTFRPLEDEVRELERCRITQALGAFGGNQTRAAAALGIPRRTFINKLKSLDIELPRRRGSRGP